MNERDVFELAPDYFNSWTTFIVQIDIGVNKRISWTSCE